MKVTIDTSHDSHEDIKKVIKMLQHLVGDSQEIFTNQPQETAASPIANIFGDVAATPSETAPASESSQGTTTETPAEETPQSTEDLFAELFSEEEIKNMDVSKAKEEEEDEEEETPKSKGKKNYNIELY